MFSIGETVSYGVQGVCRIDSVTEKRLSGKTVKYYVLKPIYQENSTIFVPADNEKSISRMRRVMSKEEANSLIEKIPDQKVCSIDNDAERKEIYKKKIESSDCREWVCVIKSLHERQCKRKESGKRLSLVDEQMMKKAEKLLYGEIALALNIKPEDTHDFIKRHIEKSVI